MTVTVTVTVMKRRRRRKSNLVCGLHVGFVLHKYLGNNTHAITELDIRAFPESLIYLSPCSRQGVCSGWSDQKECDGFYPASRWVLGARRASVESPEVNL